MCYFAENVDTPHSEAFMFELPQPLKFQLSFILSFKTFGFWNPPQNFLLQKVLSLNSPNPWISSWTSYFPLKLLAFEIPPEFPVTLHVRGMDVIWNCTIQTKQCDQSDYAMWCDLLYYKQILLCNNALQCSPLGHCLSLPATHAPVSSNYAFM